MDGNGTDTELRGIELALVQVAIEISDRYDYETQLARPVTTQSVQDAIAFIAEQGSPPLRVSVARDLASAPFETEELRPLLASTFEEGIKPTDADLEERRNELREIGPTVNWPGFPPDRPRP